MIALANSNRPAININQSFVMMSAASLGSSSTSLILQLRNIAPSCRQTVNQPWRAFSNIRYGRCIDWCLGVQQISMRPNNNTPLASTNMPQCWQKGCEDHFTRIEDIILVVWILCWKFIFALHNYELSKAEQQQQRNTC
jgi:hypothetical protein